MPLPAHDLVIDLTVPFTPPVKIKTPASATDSYEPYTGISGLTGVLSATEGAATAIHATLATTFTELAGEPGTYRGSAIAPAALQAHLTTLAGTIVYLVLTSGSEIVGESITCLVSLTRLDT